MSAVTLFKIVVYIPRYDLQYLDIRVVQAEVEESAIAISPERLKLSKNLEENEENSEFEIEALKQSRFELPKIEFEELEKLRLRRTLVDGFADPTPLFAEFKDSWAQFGEGIQRIRESISAFTPFAPLQVGETKEFEDNVHAPLMKQSVGNGIEIAYRWINPPYNRSILFIPVLLEMSKKTTDISDEKNYDFMLTVMPDGTVSRVIDLNIVEDEMSDYIEKEIIKIRFEPLITVDTTEQQVTIRYRIFGTLP